MSDLGIKNYQFAGCLDCGANYVLVGDYCVYSRNITEVRFPAPATADARLWWLGWRDYLSELYVSLLNILRIRQVPPPLRVSGVFTPSVAHKSPRINPLDLNRDLPSLPFDVDTGLSLFSFAHGSSTTTSQSRDDASEA